jgi:hypothetical protein
MSLARKALYLGRVEGLLGAAEADGKPADDVSRRVFKALQALVDAGEPGSEALVNA